MSDQDDTHPGRLRPPVFDTYERIRREIIARAHFHNMTRRQRILALACGAAGRGATLHWHGNL